MAKKNRRINVIKRDGYKCYLCQCKLSLYGENGVPMGTMDHVVPKSKGGSNDYDNLKACCEPCNTKKASKTLPQFFIHDSAGALSCNDFIFSNKREVLWEILRRILVP
jgi:5-methylcytosine-specific restriction endonuclease McrA